ncbi:MAG: RHS repeat-associated core domain-containing protein, partial [Bacteroidota bacterium]
VPANIYAVQGECSTVGDQSFYSLNPGVDYGYSVEGNMEYDPNKDITITYNYLNLPYRISKGAEEDGNFILYRYTSEGVKYSREVFQNRTLQSKKLYFHNFEYINDTLVSIYNSTGRIYNDDGNYLYEYEVQDHLGNARVRILDKNGDDQITIDTSNTALHELVGVYSYYPFGSQHDRVAEMNYANENFYGYNGKELEGEFDVGLLDYGARWSDPILGRWTSVDPLSEVRAKMTPYNYVQNNPINRIDPSGALDTLPQIQSEPISKMDFTALGAATATSGILLADDASGIGVIDDILIPFIYAYAVYQTYDDNKDIVNDYIDNLLTELNDPGDFKYIIYELRNLTGQVYVGLSSGY